MIIIVDDQYEGFDSLKEMMERLQPEPVIYQHPDDVMTFLEKNAADVSWMLIDQIFDHCTYKEGLDLGRDIVSRYDYLPLVMYTANDFETTTAVSALSTSGYAYFFHKNSITRDDVVEDKFGNITEISAEEVLRGHLNLMPSLPGFRDKAMRRAECKRNMIADLLTSLNEVEIGPFYKEMNDPDGLGAYVFDFGSQQVTLKQLLKGWLDTDALTDQQLVDEIRSSKVLPTRFVFKNMIWQHLFEAYQSATSYPVKRWKRDIEAMDIILELMSHNDPSVANQPPYYQILSNPEHLNVNFGNKKVAEELIFNAKMVARRVMLAYHFAVKSIPLIEMLPLLKSGHNNPAIIRPKKGKANEPEAAAKKNKEGLRDIYSFYKTELELSVLNGGIVNNDDKILVEEAAFKRFVKATASDCFIMLNEIMTDTRNEIRTINNLKRLLKEFRDVNQDVYQRWVTLLEQNINDQGTSLGLKNIIDYILKD